MKVVSVEVIPISIPKKTIFKVAYATRTACVSLLLKVTADNGAVGWGEAVPVAEVTGEGRREVYQSLAEWAPTGLVGVDPLDREEIRHRLCAQFPHYPSAVCAVDSALWDLRGRVLGQSVSRLLGGARETHRASMSLGIKSAEETVSETRQLLQSGFRDIKIKIGRDLAGDIERVKTLRRELGYDWRLYLDANQGYQVYEALRLVNALAEQEVEFIEQPVAAEDLDALAQVTKESVIPIAADEAVKGPESLVRLLAKSAAHMINVKLMKCGGPSNAELLIRMAEAAGLKAMVGCMIESRVGITAGLSVALGLGNVHYVDLDGCLDLVDDIVVAGGAVLEDGKQYLAGGPGMGLTVDENKVARYRDEEAFA